MSGIPQRVFGGIRPKIDPHLLPDALAQIASGCRLTSGVLSPWKQPVLVNTPSKVGTKISMYRIAFAGTDYWLHWTTDVNVVKSQIASDAFNRFYYTGDGAPKVTNDNIATQGAGTDYPLAWYTLGIPVPTTPTMGTIVGGTGANQTRAYVYTLVSAWGEEGPPSLPVSATGKNDATWTVNLPQIAQPGGGTYQVTTKNLYRTVTASDGTSSYLLVSSGIALATASYADAALDSALLGVTVLPSTSWIAPPAALSGLIALPNGSMAGFTGNQLCISEPYQPHAWPLKYRYSVDFNIVGIAANGSSIAVCTTANPYVFSGVTPDGMIPQKGRVAEPCLSKRSVIDVGWGILYASPNGLVNALSIDAEVVTKELIHPQDWQANYFPSSMTGATYQGFYHGYFTRSPGVGGGLIVDRTGDFGFKQVLDFVDGAWLDPTTGFLYIIQNGKIYKWDADPNNSVTFDWKSKLYVELKPMNYGAAQVDADYSAIGVSNQSAAQLASDQAFNTTMLNAGTDHGELGTFWLGEIPLGGSLLRGGATLATRFVQMQMYVGGVLKYTKSFTSRKIVKLPSGFKDDRYEIRLTGNIDVYAVKVAENSKALERL
jgi:hypothetical protein